MAARFFCDASVSRSVPFEKSKAARPILPVMAAPCSFQRDRKSTRLNSSHSQISYAVFCLKKKKHDTIVDRFAREVSKGSTSSVKRERELYSALLGLFDFVIDMDAALVLAAAVHTRAPLTR